MALMNINDIQTLLASRGWYAGAIDGDAGPQTMAAVETAERVLAERYPVGAEQWSDRRRLVAAGQVILDLDGHEPGQIDGYFGHNTREALIAWRSPTAAEVARPAVPGARSHPAQMAYPRQRDMPAFYGPAGGHACTAGKVDLAYPMKIAWNKRQTIRRFSCHEKLAEALTLIFRAALAHYGEAEIARLELDLFGGCYNYRKKRGGSTLSTHAFGAAVDLNPEKNQLRWGADRAQFAGAEYEPFWQIVMAHGGVPAGYAWGKDWMHFQFARL